MLNLVPAKRRGGEVYSYTYQYDYASRPPEPDDSTSKRRGSKPKHDVGVS